MRGLVFDKYEVLERLAAGGMGEVLLARQLGGVKGFERLVILKTLLPELANDQAFVDQFVDEARVVATLSHPNVVSVFEVGVWDGTYYLVMEYIPGPNLSQLRFAAAKAERPIPLALCAQVGFEAALGLHHAHSARDLRGGRLGVVHRDVSPQNIMVRVDGVAKVVDFGIARAANRSSRTEAGMVKGKLGYMSPEQLRGRDLDGRADQFSLGVTLWELCCGRYLFPQKNDNELIRAVLTSTFARPSELVPDFPPVLEDVLMRMLQREPDARFSSCYDVAQELTAWLKSQSEPHDHAAVAEFVKSVDAFPERKVTKPVTNFVVAFKPQQNAAAPRPTKTAPRTASQTRSLSPEPQPASAWVANDTTEKRPPVSRSLAPWVALGLGATVALAAAGVWWLRPAGKPALVTEAPPATVDAGAPLGAAAGEPPIPSPADEPTAPPRADEPAAAVAPSPENAPAPREVRRASVPKPVAAPPKEAPVREAPAAGGAGQLTVRTRPYTVVSVDGAIIGSTPLVRSLPAGRHTVLLVNKELGINETRQVTVAAGGTVKLDLDLER